MGILFLVYLSILHLLSHRSTAATAVCIVRTTKLFFWYVSLLAPYSLLPSTTTSTYAYETIEVESEEDEYYYDDDNTDEEEQLPKFGSIMLSSSINRESEDLLVTLRAENAAVLEEIRMIEMTVRDPVQRFKKIRDLTAKHREIVYNIKKAENPNRNPDQQDSDDSPVATTTTISSEVDTSRKETAAEAASGEDDDDYYEEEEEEENGKAALVNARKKKEEVEEQDSGRHGLSLSWNESFFSSVSDRFLCLPREFTLVASTEAELAANLSARSAKTPSAEPRAAARAKRRRDLLLSRSRAGVAGQSDEESQQLYLSKQMLEKLRDLRLKAKRIEASQPNPKKKAQMLMALAKEMEDFEKGEKAKLREQREKRRSAEGNISSSGPAGSNNLTVNGTAVSASNSSSSSLSGTADAGQGKGFRSQLQERRGQQERTREDKRMLTAGFRQGSDCEQLVCVACMVVAEVTLTQLPSLSGAKSDFLARVCQHADLRLRFSDLTTIICDHLANSKNLTRFVGMLSESGQENPSNTVQEATELLERSQRACVNVTLCEVGVSPAAATLTSLFAAESPQHRDRRCEMCRLFAQDLESTLHLSRDRHLSQENVLPILIDTCRRLGLGPGSLTIGGEGTGVEEMDGEEEEEQEESLQQLCAEMLRPDLTLRLSFMALQHKDKINRKVRAEKKFPDFMCEEIGVCQPWRGEDDFQQQEALRTMEAVYY